MAKQVFEFTDEEVIQILWSKLFKEGKVAKDGIGSISAQSRGWKKPGFDLTLKIDDSK